MLFRSRSTQLTELAFDITEKWNLLNIPENQRKEFLNQRNKLSEKDIQECYYENIKLLKLIEEKLPELNNNLINQIIEISKNLYLKEEDLNNFLININKLNNNKEKFIELDSLLNNLKRSFKLSQPIIQLIEQRNDIINNYNDLINNKNFLINKEDLKTQKYKRRFKYLLPRLEKKLLLKLLEFNTAQGYHFQWKGQDFINFLDHIILSPAEKQQAKNEGRRKSLSINNDKNFEINFHRRKRIKDF